MDVFFSIGTLVLFAFWRIYWLVTEKKADREKPKTQRIQPVFDKRRIMRLPLFIFFTLLLFQILMDLVILPMPENQLIVLFGFTFVVFGLTLAVVARHQLAANWANAYEYQIKQKHELITHGIYAYIRHPIYTGIVIAVVGAELVAMSYLFIIFAVLGFLVAYNQAKKEEKLLEGHFGNTYTAYKKRSKMLIPLLF